MYPVYLFLGSAASNEDIEELVCFSHASFPVYTTSPLIAHAQGQIKQHAKLLCSPHFRISSLSSILPFIAFSLCFTKRIRRTLKLVKRSFIQGAHSISLIYFTESMRQI